MADNHRTLTEKNNFNELSTCPADIVRCLLSVKATRPELCSDRLINWAYSLIDWADQFKKYFSITIFIQFYQEAITNIIT